MRRYAVGAEVRERTAHVRVWAPAAHAVRLHLDGRDVAMTAAGGGYFEIEVEAAAGQRYGFKLDTADDVLPDPASRFQPDGPHGLSQLIDPSRYAWAHDRWTSAPVERHVIYEMHIGTFTREGTWAGAAARLPRLRDMGLTTLEVMPIAEFPGTFNWGYDGVQWFAPFHGYGTPDDFRAFVDAAHGLGLGVILDVVYNHLGPDGNYLPAFAPAFRSTRHGNEWGDALNFDGADSAPVRALVLANTRYWVEEFRVDGFRLDAVQQIFDDSDEYVVTALAREARDAAGARALLIVGEHEPQHADLVRPASEGGSGLDAIWNEDFHHAALVALTGARFAYYSDYRGDMRELAACIRHGFLFQGQHYPWQKATRGRPALDLPPFATVCCLENHDQVANTARGQRLHQRAAPGACRAMTALLLLGPWIPMLFQGQEFGSTKPFTFFADHGGALADAVETGRRGFMSQFRTLLDPEIELPRSNDRAAFERCILDDGEREDHADVIAFFRDLMHLRAADPVIGAADRVTDAAAIDAHTLVMRAHSSAGDRLLAVTLGSAFDLSRVAEPLVAPPASGPWRVLWHSERPAYGGSGMPPLEPLRWDIPGQSAVLLGADA